MFENLGPALKGLRRRRGITIAALAQRAKLSRSTVMNYESGRTRPSLQAVETVLDGLDASLIELAVALEDPRNELGDTGDPRERGARSRLMDQVLETRARRAFGELLLALSRFAQTTGLGVVASVNEERSGEADEE